MKVLRDAVEQKAGVRLTGEDSIVYWMIRWAAMVVSRYLVGKDGMTAHERRRGRRCRIPVAAFGETVWYKKTEKHKAANKMEAKWEKGVWLGHTRDSNETVIGTSDATIRAYTIKRLPAEERWLAENIKEMKGVPQKPDPRRSGMRIPIKVTLDEEPGEMAPREIQDPEGFLSRRRGIGKEDLENTATQTTVQDAMQRNEVRSPRKDTQKLAGKE